MLAFGIIGPPECGILTGYDQDGDVILGYSYFQEPDVVGYYEQTDWGHRQRARPDRGMRTCPVRP
ncbi:hypothetical protein [Flindersiella endophytica]